MSAGRRVKAVALATAVAIGAGGAGTAIADEQVPTKVTLKVKETQTGISRASGKVRSSADECVTKRKVVLYRQFVDDTTFSKYARTYASKDGSYVFEGFDPEAGEKYYVEVRQRFRQSKKTDCGPDMSRIVTF